MSGYQTNLFCIPNHYEDSIANVMIPYGLIMDRIEKLARDCFYDMLGQGRSVFSLVNLERMNLTPLIPSIHSIVTEISKEFLKKKGLLLCC